MGDWFVTCVYTVLLFYTSPYVGKSGQVEDRDSNQQFCEIDQATDSRKSRQRTAQSGGANNSRCRKNQIEWWELGDMEKYSNVTMKKYVADLNRLIDRWGARETVVWS